MVLTCIWTTPSGDSLFNDHPLAHSMPGAGVVHHINRVRVRGAKRQGASSSGAVPMTIASVMFTLIPSNRRKVGYALCGMLHKFGASLVDV